MWDKDVKFMNSKFFNKFRYCALNKLLHILHEFLNTNIKFKSKLLISSVNPYGQW